MFVGRSADAWVFCGKAGPGEAAVLHHRQPHASSGNVGEVVTSCFEQVVNRTCDIWCLPYSEMSGME